MAIEMTNFFTIMAMAMGMASLFAMLCRLKAMAAKSLPGLGLHNHTTEEEPPPQLITEYTILVMDGLFPSLRNIPIQTLTSLIKDQLAVIQYGTYLEKKNATGDTCSVCLTAIQRSDEIRDLCNCSHVFHRDCLDRWVDENQVTCPLCRAMLFPVNWEKLLPR